VKKTVCIVISGVIAFSLAACVPAPKNSMPDSTVNKTTTIESDKIETSEISQIEISEQLETTGESDKITESISNNSTATTTDKTLSDFERIIASDNLPQYYGSYKEAEEFGKQFEKNIVTTDSYDFKSDVTILAISGYWATDEISSIELYFKNADTSLDFEKAQEIMSKFLSTEIISKYYDKPEKELYTPNDKTESSYITVLYCLNDEGKNVEGLDGQIGIIYEMQDDICVMAYIRFGIPWRQLHDYTVERLED